MPRCGPILSDQKRSHGYVPSTNQISMEGIVTIDAAKQQALGKGLLFCCVNCHYTLHADLVGARNVTMRTLLVRQDWATTGHLSVAPESSDSDVSAREAKA